MDDGSESPNTQSSGTNLDDAVAVQRPGGSDVSRTETLATLASDGQTSPNSSAYGQRYILDGFKWFSSATDSDVALALARTGPADKGTRALSLFLVPLRLPLIRGRNEPRPPAFSNHIFIHRLKDKFGTTALPTAELSLEGTEAYLLGQPGQGVKLITPVLNITRVHSATGSVGALRRCLAIATEYSKVRAVKGGSQLLQDAPLHVADLAKVSVLYRALVHLLFGTVALLGKVECGVATEGEANRLRLLTPALKAFAAAKSVTAMEECMAALGGAGYMTETEIGQFVQLTAHLSAFTYGLYCRQVDTRCLGREDLGRHCHCPLAGRCASGFQAYRGRCLRDRELLAL